MIITCGTTKSSCGQKFSDFCFPKFFVFGKWISSVHNLCPNGHADPPEQSPLQEPKELFPVGSSNLFASDSLSDFI